MVQEFLLGVQRESLLRIIGQGTHLSPKAMTVPGRADQKSGTILSPLIMNIVHCACQSLVRLKGDAIVQCTLH